MRNKLLGNSIVYTRLSAFLVWVWAKAIGFAHVMTKFTLAPWQNRLFWHCAVCNLAYYAYSWGYSCHIAVSSLYWWCMCFTAQAIAIAFPSQILGYWINYDTLSYFSNLIIINIILKIHFVNHNNIIFLATQERFKLLWKIRPGVLRGWHSSQSLYEFWL